MVVFIYCATVPLQINSNEKNPKSKKSSSSSSKQRRLTSARLVAPLQGIAGAAAPVQQAVGGQDGQERSSEHGLRGGAVARQGLPRLLTIHLGRRGRSQWGRSSCTADQPQHAHSFCHWSIWSSIANVWKEMNLIAFNCLSLFWKWFQINP